MPTERDTYFAQLQDLDGQRVRALHALSVLTQDYETQGEQLAIAHGNVRALRATVQELQAVVTALGGSQPTNQARVDVQ